MQFHGVGNTNNPEQTPFGDHLRKEADLPPLPRSSGPLLSEMVRDYWDAINAGLEAALEAETREQYERGEL